VYASNIGEFFLQKKVATGYFLHACIILYPVDFEDSPLAIIDLNSFE